MKKIFFINCLLFFVLGGIFASDVTLYNEINLSFKNGFYPGTVDKAVQFENQYPESVFLLPSTILKAESQIEMALYDDSFNSLKKIVNQTHFGSVEYAHCNYLFGKIFFYKGENQKALKYFYEACNSSLTAKNLEFYNPSVFYSANIFFILNDYENAIPLFEYVLQNPQSCPSFFDYCEVLQKTMICFNKTGNPQKANELFLQVQNQNENQNEKNVLPDEVYLSLCIYNADALALLKKNLEAYELYCDVVKKSDGNLAVIALKKSYVLASENKIGVNAGEVFANTADKFSGNPELVNEFWIRLGIDEFEKENYKKAMEYFSNVDEKNPVRMFYSAKNQLDCEKNPLKAEKILEELQNQIENQEKVKMYQISDNSNSFYDNSNPQVPVSETSTQKILENQQKNLLPKNFNDAFYSLFVLVKFQLEKWDEIPPHFKKIENPKKNDVYALSASYYAKGEWEKVDSSTGLLYASALGRSGKFLQAEKVFSSVELDSKGKIEYSKVLFKLKKFDEAYKTAAQSNENEKEYICGLCKINLKDWNEAKNHFSQYIKQNSSKNDFTPLVFFYKGYAEYCLEEYKNAYASFVRFDSETSDVTTRKLSSTVTTDSFLKKSYEYAAKSALQNSDFKNASVQAEKLIKKAHNRDEKQKAILFCADIFADYEDYDNALEILLPYAKKSENKDELNYEIDFAVQAMFKTAKVYEKKGDLKNADEFYSKIYEQFPKSILAQEALYCNAELFYSFKEYAFAFNKFNDYVYGYPAGDFVDAALFFGADCALRLGETERSIIFNNTMLQKYPQSVYAYGANINLLEAYYQKENYVQALQIAKNLVKTFPSQAADDGIGTKLVELEKIVQGTDRRIVEKQSEYEKAGKSSTKKGRIFGSQLVKLYAENSATQKEAFSLASEIFEKQNQSGFEDENPYAAENAEFLADFYRKNQKNKESAQMYLKAAEKYRSFDDSKSAVVLYSATEAFLAEGLFADAREVADFLKENYPETRQAQRVDRLFENLN